MYMPKAFAVEDRALILDVLRQTAFGHLVTTTADSMSATALPFIVNDELTVLQAHFSRANQHWKSIDGAPGLMIVPVNDAYISPRWYPSKAEHGKVVPTWNYELIHLHGTVEVHDDTEWKRQLVSELTNQSEQRVTEPGDPWKVSDAPTEFIDGQLKAIVGMELGIRKIEAKRKLSQNRLAPDRVGAIDGLSNSTRPRDAELARLMQESPPDEPSGQ